jgi:hypothetical protein
MNPGVMVAIHAAAAAQKAKTDALDAFRVHGATAAERARPLRDLGLTLETDAVAKLIESGVVRGVDSRGRLTVLGDSIDRVEGYYLDEVAFIANRDGTDRRTNSSAVKWVICSLAVVAIAAALALVAIARKSG